MRLKGLLAFCLLFQIGFSQNYTIKAFSKNEGLSDPFVYSILQDYEGYLFVATGKELQKFDGQFFKNVKVRKADDEFIYSGAVTQGNALWFGTFNGNVYYYDKEQEVLKRFSQQVKGSVTKILALKNSNGFCVFSRGNGVYATNGKALFRIKNSENLSINAIEILSENLILAACDDGLYKLNIKTNETYKYSAEITEIKFIQKTSTDTYVILSPATGIVELRIHTNDSLEIIQKLILPEKVANDGITSFFYVKKHSELFLSTSDEKLSIYNTIKGTFTYIPAEEFSSSVNDFYLDAESNVWVATPGKGIFRFSKTEYEYINSENQPVYAISEDNEGNTYLALSDGILVKTNTGHFKEKINTLASSATGKINALYFDSNILWIGTETKGLFLLDPTLKKLRSVQFSSEKNCTVNSISGNGKQVVVTTNLDGVFIYENYVLKNHFSVQNGLVHNNVYYSLLSKSGHIFYATHNTTFNYSQGDELFEIDVKEGGLNSDFNSFAEDAKGNIFIATNGDGIYLFNGKSIKSFTFNQKLESMYCHGLLVDKMNDLWIMQLDNLYKCHTNKQLLKKQSFNYKGNLHFNPNASYLNKKGDVFFGTDKNALVFHYDTIRDLLPRTYLSQLSVNDSLFSVRKNLKLEYGMYDIDFEISALCLKNSEAVNFSHILEGRDKEWSEPDNQRVLKYAKLSEGDYYLKVRSYNSQGFTQEEPFIFHIKISSPYWKKPIFWFALSITLVLLIYGIVRLRTRKLQMAKLRLEQLVDEKTKQLREEKEIVIKSEKVIQEKNQEIRDSITYAKRIQEALLTEGDLLNKYKQQLFVFYQPRDIVSGDFYWMSEVSDLKIIVAADCTGHGVPGALMSMIGSTLLNKIVHERQIVEPKAILEALDLEIKHTLKQYTDTATRDGMDICLCCIDERKGILTYAGAMRPLYLIRESRLIEYAPTKLAIGGYSYGKLKQFNETVIRLKKNDQFYLFSDGYADQFGGGHGKKLMVKNFKTLLLSLSNMEMEDQKEALANHYENWKGETPQIDDVLVIGIKV